MSERTLKLGLFESAEYVKLLHGLLDTYRDALVEVGIKAYSLDFDKPNVKILEEQTYAFERKCLACYSAILKWQEKNNLPVQTIPLQELIELLMDKERWEFYYSKASGMKHNRRYQNLDEIEKEYRDVIMRRLTGNLYGPL